MAPASIVPAVPAFATDGTPYSEQFADVYHSASGALEQARHVFIAGNDLPARWRGCADFIILETGFGLGLNFLVTWQAWRNDPTRSQRLHFVSVEKHPFHGCDLANLHARWPELAGLSALLIDAWPPLEPGLHTLQFDTGQVTLTLAFGDGRDLLPLPGIVPDAIYLDGFSPAKNPGFWSESIVAALAQCSSHGTTLASWSVAEDVMKRLSGAGFDLEKRPGFGTKRYMLAGRRGRD